MISLDRLAERLSTSRIAALGAAGTAGPLLATLATTGIGDVILILASLTSAIGGGVLWRRRRLLLSLPLEIGQHAIRGEVDGAPVVRFRARLGHGRRARRPEVEVRFVGDAGQARTLEAEIPAQELCGPFTITARDPGDLTARPGVLTVRVEVQEGDRRWSAEREFQAFVPGRFVPPVRRIGGRVQLERERWDAVEVPEGTPEPEPPIPAGAQQADALGAPPAG